MTLLDGTTVEYFQVKTRGQSGPDVTVIEEYRFDGRTSQKTGEYMGSSAGLVEVTVGGLLGSIVTAVGNVGASAIHEGAHVTVQK